MLRGDLSNEWLHCQAQGRRLTANPAGKIYLAAADDFRLLNNKNQPRS